MYNYGPRNPRKRVEILNEIDVSTQQRYKSARLIKVTNGRSDFCCKGKANNYSVMLENEPLCEIYLHDKVSPIIRPLLKPSDEKGTMAAVKYALNMLESNDFHSQVEVSIPLLASLEDGYYLIIDALLYPANGNKDFFYQLNRETPMESLVDPGGLRASPAYIFPTESFPSSMNTYRLKPNEKAIAYYLGGYLTLLMSGHKLAVDAAVNGNFLPTMVIVPCTNITAKSADFADVSIPIDEFQFAPKQRKIIQSRGAGKEYSKRQTHNACDITFRSLWRQYPLLNQKCEIANGLQQTSIPSLKFEYIEDQRAYPHYKDMILVKVKNGKGQLYKKGWNGFYKLYLKDTPLVQIYEFGTTDRPRLAPAYSMSEGCEEIQKAVKNIAAMEKQTISGYAEALTPIFELLCDGTYVIADTMLYPSTGESFFWSIPNFPSTCCALAAPQCGFPRPAYICPTIHPGCYSDNSENAMQTARMLDHGPSRAISYYLQGYMSVLLYGHSMAAMAAFSHKELPSLVVIPYSDLVAVNGIETLGRFADIVLPIEDAEAAASKMVKEMVEYEKQPEIRLQSGWSQQFSSSWMSYPTPERLVTKLYENTEG